MAYYTFDSSNIVADASGKLGPLTVSGVSPTTQAAGPWNGSNSAVFTQTGSTMLSGDVTNGQAFALPSITTTVAGISICAWFNPTATSPWASIYSFGSQGTNGGNSVKFGNSGNTVTSMFTTWYINNVGLYTGLNIYYPNSWNLNAWMHTCQVVAGTSSILYINGIANSATLSTSYSATSYSTTYSFIARAHFYGDGLFKGAIDEVRLYPRALSAAEVAVIYSYNSTMTTATMPVACPSSGFYSTVGASACLTCPAGSACANGVATVCLAGFYSGAGAAACTACGTGYTSAAGSTACVCVAGYGNASSYLTQLPLTASMVSWQSTLPMTGSLACVVNGITQMSELNTCGGVGVPITDVVGSCTASSCSVPVGVVQVNLTNITVIGEVDLWSYHWDSRSFFAVKVELSTTCQFAGEQYTALSSANLPSGPVNTNAGTPGIVISVPAIPALCVRWSMGSSNLNTGVIFIEIAIKSVSPCAACAIGSSSPGGSAVCSACPAGSFAASMGSPTCTACPAGSYSAATGASNCSLCPSGTFSNATNATNATTCSSCVVGYGSFGGSSACYILACSAGSYLASTSTACATCAAGSFSVGNASNCSMCQGGTFSVGGASSCSTCQGGTFSVGNASACTPCPTGTYSAALGQTTCVNCPSFASPSVSGLTSITQCNGGATLLTGLSSTTTFTAPTALYAHVLLIGGGSGGETGSWCKAPCRETWYCTCYDGRGGGAGAVIFYPNYMFTADTYTVTIGAGNQASSIVASNGNPVFMAQAGTLTASGGSLATNCVARVCNVPAGFCSSGVGNSSLYGCQGGTDFNNYKRAAGGGAGGVGGAGDTQTGGSGMNMSTINGVTYGFAAIFGSAYTSAVGVGGYVGGGGGGGGSGVCGSGGIGGGGAGANDNDNPICASIGWTATAGATNTGGGGGGGTHNQFAQVVGGGGGSGMVLIKWVCPVGYYGNTTVGCTPCSAGTFSIGGTTACSGCTAGTFSGGNASSCSLCLSGSFSVGNASSCSTCQVGTFSPANSSTCTACATGAYCLPGSSVSTLCAAGSFCTNSSSQILCTRGSYSIAGSTSCTVCANGLNSAAGDSICSACLSGSYCVNGTQSLCPGGTFSISGSSGCATCPIATYTAPGATICQVCARGSYSNISNVSACQQCTIGSFSTSNASVCTTCSSGTYSSSTGSTGCRSCLGGWYCINGLMAVCPTGYYSLYGTAASACIACAPGSFMNGRSITNYNNTLGLTQINFAQAVIADMLLVGGGGSGASDGAGGGGGGVVYQLGVYIPAGLYTVQVGGGGATQTSYDSGIGWGYSGNNGGNSGIFIGSTTTTSLIQIAYGGGGGGGHYGGGTNGNGGGNGGGGGHLGWGGATLQAPTDDNGIPGGYIGGNTGSTNQGDGGGGSGVSISISGSSVVYACGGGGSYWGHTTTTYTNIGCGGGGGYYGSYSNENSGAGTAGIVIISTYIITPCSAGGYASGGATVCSICNAGSFSLSNASVCTLCRAGSFSTTPSATTASACTSCSTGQYCPLGSTTNPQCLTGYYCPNATIQIQTPLGFYSAADGATSTTACQPCSPYATQTVICPAGSTSDVSSCAQCNAGYFGNGRTCTLCPPNYWCFAGVNNGCPLQTNSPANSSSQNQCQCNAGFVGNGSMATTSPCAYCWAGFYCPGGNSNTSYTCPSNSTSPPGSSSILQCMCRPGFFGNNGTNCTLCTPNSYCASGKLSNCSANSQSTAGSAVLSSCTCNPGFYGPVGGNCTQCPTNSYCTGGSNISGCVTNAVTAGPQTISAGLCFCDRGYSGINNSACVSCVAGTWCWTGIPNNCPPNTNSAPRSSYNTNCTCNAGYSGSGGGPSCTQCGVGYYSAQGASACVRCSAGSYSATAAASSCVGCSAGGYSAASFTACLVCPAGSYYNGSGVMANLARSCGGGACTATESSVYGGLTASGGNDGGTNNLGGWAVTNNQNDAWWMVDLGAPQSLGAAKIYGRTDCCFEWMSGFMVWVGSNNSVWNGAGNTNCYTSGASLTSTLSQGPYYAEYLGCVATARYFWVVTAIRTNPQLALIEVEVYPPTCLSCPAGSFSNANATTCSLCSTGQYCPAASTTNAQCLAGYYCPNTTVQIACRSGTSSPTVGATNATVCGLCPAVTYSSYGASACTPCAGDTYTAGPGSSACTSGAPTCNAGAYADPNIGTCAQCQAGTYQPTSVSYWAPYSFDGTCGGGWVYDNQTVLGQVVYKSGEWYLWWWGFLWLRGYKDMMGGNIGYCLGPMIPGHNWYDNGNGAFQYLQASNVQNCPPCSAGNFCPSGSAVQLACAAGYYCPNTTVQLPCPTGYSCGSGATAPTICPNGAYSPTNASSCSTCAAVGNSTWTSGGTNATGCAFLCNAGYYASGRACAVCAAGFYCSSGSTAQTLCTTTGSYCPANSGAQTLCAAGFCCPNTTVQIPCASGQYCPAASTTNAQCLAGYYCPNTTVQIPCSSNTFSVAGSSVCAQCLVGSSSLVGSSACVALAGYYDLGLSLMAYYTFDAANMVADSAPTPLGALTASGTPPTTGVGQWNGSNAAVFTGGGSLAIPTFIWPYSGAFTVCAWYQPTGVANYGTAFILGQSGGRQSLQVSRTSTSDNLWVKWNDGTTGANSNQYGGYFTNFAWNHICAVSYNNNNSGAVSLNGVLSGAQVVGVGVQGPTTGNSIGGGYIVVDEFRMYPRALSQAEVSSIYSYNSTTTTALMPVICPAGTFSLAGASACSACPAGSYAASAGLSVCVFCAPGTVTGSSVMGATTAPVCSSCQAGAYSYGSRGPQSWFAGVPTAIPSTATVMASSFTLDSNWEMTFQLMPTNNGTGSLLSIMSTDMSSSLFSSFRQYTGITTFFQTSTRYFQVTPSGYSVPANRWTTILIRVIQNTIWTFMMADDKNDWTGTAGMGFVEGVNPYFNATVVLGSASPAAAFIKNVVYTPSTSTCTLCGTGLYSAATGATSGAVCVGCSAGSYASGLGLTACLQCVSGTYAAANATTCTGGVVCGAGSYARIGATSASGACVACAPNTFSVSGSSVCAACPVGSSSVVGSSACVAVAGYYDLGQSLMAYYTFDASNMTADSAPIPLGALTASATPPTSTAGKWAGSSAANFSQATKNELSSNAGQSFSLPSFTQMGTDISVCGWYQTPPDSVSAAGGTRSNENVFNFAVSSNGGSNVFVGHWGMWNGIQAFWFNGATVLGNDAYFNDYYYPLAWVHFCAVASGASGNLYLQGVSHPIPLSAAITPGVVRASNYIGRSHVETDSLFQGVIDELRIYPRALTQAEVSAISSYTGVMTTATMPVACPSGMYSAANASACTQCLAAYYCPNTTVQIPCASGQYCPATSTSNPQCLAGYYCPNTTVQILCGSGQYCPGTSTTNAQCLAGYYCLSTTSQLICPAGYYCATGCTSPSPCAAGKYSSGGSSACSSCPSPSTSNSAAANYTSCFCPPGSMGNVTSPTSASCVSCPSGTFCAGVSCNC